MEFSIYSTIGNIRQNNEDNGSFYKKPGGEFIAVVCDGMGGHIGGGVASKMATDFIVEEYKLVDLFRSRTPEEIKEWFQKTLEIIKKHFLITIEEDYSLEEMGTTIVVAIGVGNKLYVANIGDSRAYILHKLKLTQITEDHNLANKLLNQGQINKKEAKWHPSKNMLYNVFSLKQELKFDWFTTNLVSGCLLLLMTDGVYSEMKNIEIIKIIKNSSSIESAVVAICKQANENGGKDNNTILIGEF